MATRRIIIIIISIIILNNSLSFGKEPNLPRNVFERDPALRYYVWWKPYRVIFDREKVLDIQKQIDAIPVKQEESIELDKIFGENKKSAFLFLVLSTNGEKGVIILNRFLNSYKKAEYDDEWLLIIASLGRIPTPQAQKILEEQLERLLKEWKSTKLVTISGRQVQIPNLDVRTAPLEALIACLAGQKKLTAKTIDLICNEEQTFSWEVGLEWAHQLMPEKNVLQIIEDGLNMCDEKEILKAMDLQVSSERLYGISNFLLGPKDVWPLTEKLLLSNKVFKPEVLDFLIINYMYILRYKAEIGDGIYPLDDNIVNLFTKKEVIYHGKLSYISKILLGCKTSKDYPEWQQFLTKHAKMLDPMYETSVETEIKRVFGTEKQYTKNTYEREERIKAFMKITQPGVYMKGFHEGL
jgi:hypothetical protein